MTQASHPLAVSLSTRFLRSILCLLAILATQMPTASAEVSLVSHTAEYKIKISLLGGTLKTIVQQTDAGFSSSSVIKPTGIASWLMKGTIEESSEFTAGSDGIRPMVYDSADTLSKEDKFMHFDFDWEGDSLSGKINGEEFSFELSDNVHDRVSIQYELMHNLLNGKTSSEYGLLDGEKLKQIQIKTIGTKEIKTPFGKFMAIGIQHSATNSSRVSTLWCAEELGYLPVLIEQHRRGKRRVRAVLTNYERIYPPESTVGQAN
jgi:hypothetical protein